MVKRKNKYEFFPSFPKKKGKARRKRIPKTKVLTLKEAGEILKRRRERR